MKFILNKIIGSQNTRELQRVKPIVDKINSLEDEISKLSDEELRRKTDNFKEHINKKKDSLKDEMKDLRLRIEEASFPQEKDKLKL